MSYLQLYIYRIKSEKSQVFLDIIRKTNNIFNKYGVKGEEVYKLHNKESKYGVTGIWEILHTLEDEEIWIGLNRFNNDKHCSEIMKKFDEDSDTELLYNEFIEKVSPAINIIRGEFQIH